MLTVFPSYRQITLETTSFSPTVARTGVETMAPVRCRLLRVAPKGANAVDVMGCYKAIAPNGACCYKAIVLNRAYYADLIDTGLTILR